MIASRSGRCVGRVEQRRHALAPRRRAQPGQVDDVGVVGEVCRAREPLGRVRAPRVNRSARLAPSAAAPRRPRRGPAATTPSSARSRASNRSTIVSRVGRCCGPERDLHPLVGDGDATRARCPVWAATDTAPDGQPPAALLHRADDHPRGMQAAEAPQPVLDLLTQAGIDDRDEVEHAGGDRQGTRPSSAPPPRQVIRRSAASIRAGERVLLAPDARPSQAPPRAGPLRAARSAAAGPGEPAGVGVEPALPVFAPALEDRLDDRPLRVASRRCG